MRLFYRSSFCEGANGSLFSNRDLLLYASPRNPGESSQAVVSHGGHLGYVDDGLRLQLLVVGEFGCRKSKVFKSEDRMTPPET